MTDSRALVAFNSGAAEPSVNTHASPLSDKAFRDPILQDHPPTSSRRLHNFTIVAI